MPSDDGTYTWQGVVEVLSFIHVYIDIEKEAAFTLMQFYFESGHNHHRVQRGRYRSGLHSRTEANETL